MKWVASSREMNWWELSADRGERYEPDSSRNALSGNVMKCAGEEFLKTVAIVTVVLIAAGIILSDGEKGVIERFVPRITLRA